MRLPSGRIVHVAAFYATQPHLITMNDISMVWDAEIRRFAIDRYKLGRRVSGAAAYVRDRRTADCVDDDPNFGTLWRLAIPGDEPIAVVEVLDATPMKRRRPGGKRRVAAWRKHYWLRVPPHVQTARQAVAWTFRMREEQYFPTIEA